MYQKCIRNVSVNQNKVIPINILSINYNATNVYEVALVSITHISVNF